MSTLVAGRAWSAATAIYPNGRTEAIAVAPGIPSLRSKRSGIEYLRGQYAKLYDMGQLEIAEGLRGATTSDAMGDDTGNLGQASDDNMR